MKLRLTFKTPDVTDEPIKEAVQYIQDEEEREDNRRQLEQLCRRWVGYGEYITVEIDAEEGTATVLEAGR